jgi:hypothetical protein
MTKFTAADIARMREQRRSGLTYRKIAELNGCCPEYVPILVRRAERLERQAPKLAKLAAAFRSPLTLGEP